MPPALSRGELWAKSQLYLKVDRLVPLSSHLSEAPGCLTCVRRFQIFLLLAFMAHSRACSHSLGVVVKWY